MLGPEGINPTIKSCTTGGDGLPDYTHPSSQRNRNLANTKKEKQKKNIDPDNNY